MIFVVHGIGKREGSGSVDNWITPLRDRGYEVQDAQLPRRNWLTADWTIANDGRILAAQTHSGDSLIAHSNGCGVALEAAKMHKYKVLFLLRPALSVHYDLRSVRGNPRIYTDYSDRDGAIFLGALLPGHRFGRAGRYGFRQLVPYGPDWRGRTSTEAYLPGRNRKGIGKHNSCNVGVELQRLLTEFDLEWDQAHDENG